MLGFFRENKIVCGLAVLLAVLILGFIIFWVAKSLSSDQKISKPEDIIPVQTIKENFDSLISLPVMNGKFLNFDEKKSEVSVMSFSTSTLAVAEYSFKVDNDTVFSKITDEFDQVKLLSRENLLSFPVGSQIIIFYSVPESPGQIPLAKMIQVEDLIK